MKKIILSLITFLSVAMCSVVAFIGLSSTPKTAIGGGHYKNIGEEVIIDDNTPKPIEKPSTITYAPNTISVQKGGDSINYNYTPSVNAQDDATPTHTVAYEYCFGNPMDRKTAVNLKSIDTTGVEVSYYYSTSKIDTTSTLIGETDFTLQEMESDARVYIYVLVSPINENIPTTFTQSIVWYYGIPKEISIVDNVTNSVIDTQTIVSGQKIDEETLTKPESFTRTEQGKVYDEDNWSFVDQEVTVTYYFDAWFYDKDFTQIVDGNNSAGRKIYARFHNIDPSKTEYWGYSDEGYTFSPDEYQDNYWYGAGWDYCNTTGIRYPVIPTTYDDGVNGKANVVGIGHCAFYYDNEGVGAEIQSVDLPYSITSIGGAAFYQCSKLTSITIPSSVTSIGNSAFQSCSSLTSITIPNSVTSIGYSAFSSCYSLTSITIPSSVTSISGSAFFNCSSLTSITIPAGVTSIGSYAFEYCYNLYEVYNLSNLSITMGSTNNGYVGYYAKAVHTSLTEASVLTTIGEVVYFMESSSSYIAIGRDRAITSATLDSRTTAINQFAFSYCRSLTSITIPSSVTSIGEHAFYFCGNLTSVTFGDNSQLTSIGDYVFYNCDSLTSITIPSSVTSIGYYAFFSCNNLTSITFEDTSTWYKTSSSNYTGGSVVDVTNPTQNATWFKSTRGYYDYYWYKI